MQARVLLKLLAAFLVISTSFSAVAYREKSKRPQKRHNSERPLKSSKSKVRNGNKKKSKPLSKAKANTRRGEAKQIKPIEAPKQVVAKDTVKQQPGLEDVAVYQKIVAQLKSTLNLVNAAQLKPLLNAGGLEMKVMQTEGRYSPDGATKLLGLFFQNYKPVGFKLDHKGKTETGLGYLIGHYICNPTTQDKSQRQTIVQLYLVYKLRQNTVSIQTLELDN